MDILLNLIAMLGGLALFLYGMEVMGDGLKRSSADTLKRSLEKVTSNPVSGFVLGLIVTAVIQSSTATIVLTVGLLGAGVLNLKQSISITMGANVGTTITGQIIRLLDVDGGNSVLSLFQPDTLAPLAALIGIIFIMFIKKESSRNIGVICMGFGILFIGLMNMTTAMEPLSDTPAFSRIILQVSDNSFLGLLCGIVMTVIVQSSSASVGILQTLSKTGQIGFAGAYGYVVGAALGTCLVTAIICSIDAKQDAKRTIVVNVIFNIISVVLCVVVMELLHACGLIDAVWNSAMNSSSIANFQTAFKLIAALLLMPFVPLLERTAYRIIKTAPMDPGELEIHRSVQALDEHLFMSPALALAQTETVIGHMSDHAMRNYDDAISLIQEYDVNRLELLRNREDLLDHMADVTNQYLVDLSPNIDSEQDNRRLSYLIQALTIFERIGDIAMNIMRSVNKLHETGTSFSAAAQHELCVTTSAVHEVLQLTVQSFHSGDINTARQVEPLEEVVDDLVEELKARHIERIKCGLCSISTGIYFNDILINLERISDHCSDLAVYTIQLSDSSIKGKVHSYIHNLHSSGDDQYIRLYADNRQKYLSDIDEGSEF